MNKKIIRSLINFKSRVDKMTESVASAPETNSVQLPQKREHSISSSDDESVNSNTSYQKSVKKGCKPVESQVIKKQKLLTQFETVKSSSSDSGQNSTIASYNSCDVPLIDTIKSSKDGKPWNFKICSWNIAGIRAWVKKNGLDYIKKENPDIISLQEVKCPENKLPLQVNLPGYHTYWIDSQKSGYAGVALYSKLKPITIKKGLGIKDHDSEGRVITAEYDNFFVVGVYVPNSGSQLKTLSKRLKWDSDFLLYLVSLKSIKPVILCGDLNVAHESIDLARPDTNTKSPGFTVEERKGLTDLLNQGFIDSFRHLYPDVTGAYTFWAYFNNARARNTGWRIDYFVISESLLPKICDCIIRKDVQGSDHCPIILYLSL